MFWVSCCSSQSSSYKDCLQAVIVKCTDEMTSFAVQSPGKKLWLQQAQVLDFAESRLFESACIVQAYIVFVYALVLDSPQRELDQPERQQWSQTGLGRSLAVA